MRRNDFYGLGSDGELFLWNVGDINIVGDLGIGLHKHESEVLG